MLQFDGSPSARFSLCLGKTPRHPRLTKGKTPHPPTHLCPAKGWMPHPSPACGGGSRRQPRGGGSRRHPQGGGHPPPAVPSIGERLLDPSSCRQPMRGTTTRPLHLPSTDAGDGRWSPPPVVGLTSRRSLDPSTERQPMRGTAGGALQLPSTDAGNDHRTPPPVVGLSSRRSLDPSTCRRAHLPTLGGAPSTPKPPKKPHSMFWGSTSTTILTLAERLRGLK